MANAEVGNKVGVVDGGVICMGVVNAIEDGMCDIDFDDGDEGTYPIGKVKIMLEDKPPLKADAEELAKLRIENAKLKEDASKPQGIKDAKNRTRKGEQPRADELMKKHIQSAQGKTRENMTEAEVVSVERTIRKYVKKGGIHLNLVTDKKERIKPGWRKGLSDEKIAYAKILIARMGGDPENPSWDESILVPGFSDTLKGTKSKL